jgi:hypothetical protein
MCFHLFMLLWIFLQQFLENFQRIQFLEFVEGNVFAGPNALNYFLRVVNGPRLVKCGRVDNGDVQSPGAKSCAETFNYIDGWKSLDGLGNSSINDGDGKQQTNLPIIMSSGESSDGQTQFCVSISTALLEKTIL